MKKYTVACYAAIISVSLLWSCGENKPPQPPTPTATNVPPPTKAYVKPPQFNKDSAYAFVAKQVSFGPRVPNTPAQKKCADWLEAKLRSYTKDVIVQSGKVTAYTGEELQMYNIIARFNPENTNRIMLCAHWDTRPFADQDKSNKKAPLDGADDGGSGVGILLEIARLLSQTPSDAGVDIILFDTEDYGNSQGGAETYCLGSQYWAKNPPIKGYYAKYGILLDMVGAKGAKFAKEGNSMQMAPSVVEKIWSTAARLGYGDMFTQEMATPIVDDHYFIREGTGIPCVDIINFGKHNGDDNNRFGAHWHTQNDKLSNIDKSVLEAVGQTVLDVVYNE